MRSNAYLLMLLVAAGFGVERAVAYPVQQSLGLAELEKEADLICKVEVGPSQPANPSP